MTYRVPLVCVLFLLTTLPMMAQERGQYIPGTGGLNSGIQTPEGITFLVAEKRYGKESNRTVIRNVLSSGDSILTNG